MGGPRTGGSGPQSGPDRPRAPGRVGAVAVEERQRDAVDTEAEARRVRHFAVVGLDAEGAAEVVEMTVGRGDSCLPLDGVHRGDDLVLELLDALVGGQHPTGPTEERVV